MEEDQNKMKEISVDQAKNIDTTKVAYFTLTDGTVIQVKSKDEKNKGNTIKSKNNQSETMETNQDIKQESPEANQNEEVQEKEIKKEERENEDINTNSNQIKNQQQEEEEEDNQENMEQDNYENQDQEIIEKNYVNYGFQSPQEVVEYEDEDEDGGKIMTYGGIIEERRNYRFYASGIEHIQPERDQQLIETGGQEYIEEQIDNQYNEDEDQGICQCNCHRQSCIHCCGKNINQQGLYKYVETVPVETVEYVDEYPRQYEKVRYVVEREPEYVPYDGYIVEEIIDDNNYNRCCCHCHCGNRYYYDDYNGEYYEYVDEPRCMCPLGRGEYIKEKKFVRRVNPRYNTYYYY